MKRKADGCAKRDAAALAIKKARALIALHDIWLADGSADDKPEAFEHWCAVVEELRAALETVEP